MGIEEMINEYKKQIENNMKYIKREWACEADRISGMKIAVDVLRKVVKDLQLLKSSLPTQQDKVVVPELHFPQSVVDWLETPSEEDQDELLSYIMRYYWNEDSAYDDTIPSEVGEYLAEGLSNVVKLLRAVEGESYTVEKEQLYYVTLPEKNTDTYNVYGLKKYSDGKINVACYDKGDIGKSMNSKLTEREIKSVHENYWPFAVPVEEEAE